MRASFMRASFMKVSTLNTTCELFRSGYYGKEIQQICPARNFTPPGQPPKFDGLGERCFDGAWRRSVLIFYKLSHFHLSD